MPMNPRLLRPLRPSAQPIAVAPSSPQNFAAFTGADPASIDVFWDPPASDGGSPITEYRAYASMNAEPFELVATFAANLIEGQIFFPYEGGRLYDIRMTAVNAAGESEQTATSQATVSDSEPPAPIIDAAQAQAGYVIGVEWSMPFAASPAISDYEFSYQPEGGGETTLLTAGSDSYVLTLSNMNSGVEYAIRVRAVNNIGSGPWSDYSYATAADVPAASQSTGAGTSMMNPGAIYMSALVPAANGSPITAYDVQVALDSNFSVSVTTVNFQVSPEPGYINPEVTGLPGGVTYYARIRFVNAVGEGEWSSGSASAMASASPPSQVAGFTAVADYSEGAFRFEWAAPASGGSAILSYEIQNSPFIDDWLPENGTVSYYPGYDEVMFWGGPEAYDEDRYFRIRAINAIGEGEWSAVESAIYHTPTVPDPPTITAAVCVAEQETSIAYTPGFDGYAPIANYNFYIDGDQYEPDSYGANTVVFSSNWTGATVTMTAFNGVGESAPSNSVTVTAG